MAQVVAEAPYTIENSTHLSRPDFKTFLHPDTNVGETDVTEFTDEKKFRELHIPNSTGPLNYDVTCCDNNLAVKAPMPITTKKRTEFRILDPCSGFISPAGEFYLRSEKTHLGTFGKSRVEPQTTIPQTIHSVRTRQEAIDELKRAREGEGEPILNWSDNKISDTVLRARLGGWTSESKLPTNTESADSPYRLRHIFPNMKTGYNDEAFRDELAKKYLYTTSTQEMYSNVNWDNKVPKKLHAPITTYEFGKSDPLKPPLTGSTKPELFQTVAGSAWDRVQYRNPNFFREAVSFTAPSIRGNHLPGYSGHIGGKNLQHMDDVIEKFTPFTVLRTQQPKEPEPNYKPNIPGYTGHVHNFKTTSVSHYDDKGRPYTTTAAYHRQLPMEIPTENYSLAGDFSRIQTRVPPQNAYDQIKRPVDIGINNSIDNVKHPIVNMKDTNHQNFLVANREKEIKSILKQ
ncbi:unnamed protein product [Brachionus calyciflorus]|uniref:Uncharacterized protein n=1 Tax=Brachionus calyciflorus TaxID=104777 RepID=A0A813M2Y6_9BILA|nr:unnamed protein product [Brachionus calyciflorus]